MRAAVCVAQRRKAVKAFGRSRLAALGRQQGVELATIVKPFGLTNRSFKRARGERTNTTHLIQFVHDGVILMPALELLFALGHALFGQVDLGQHDMQHFAQQRQLGAI